MTREAAKQSARERREYLRQKGAAFVAAALVGAIALMTFAIVLFLVIGIEESFTVWGGYMLAPFLMLLPVFLVLTLMFFRLYRVQSHKAASIPYVPRVAQRPMALPGEVLLRGSCSLPAPPQDLLRAAQQGAEAPSEELMRPSEKRTI